MITNMPLLPFPIYTKEELRAVVDKLIEAGNSFADLYKWIPHYTYNYYANTGAYDISYYGKWTLRYRDKCFVEYL